ncbi:hypothetical protein BD413DRAFT_268644 [Trametes elegans]|nr:hypothetical protein BD413DRAFT_268644 [Trametes elegans]
MTSALVPSPLRPLTTAAAPTHRDNSLASTQHSTDRFPRFVHLLRTGTPKPEPDGGLVRPSAELAELQASLATIPDPPAQRGAGDTTCLWSCLASPSPSASTWARASLTDSSPLRASTPTPVPARTLAPASHPLQRLAPCTSIMANTSSSTGPRGGAGTTPRVPVPTRRGAPATGADAIAGERIMPGTPLSTSPTSQASSDWADAQGADADELELDDGQTGGSTGDGQPKKKKTRRAGAAITRVRRMQREVRRLAEEEDQTGVQRQQPQRVRPFFPTSPLSPISQLAC